MKHRFFGLALRFLPLAALGIFSVSLIAGKMNPAAERESAPPEDSAIPAGHLLLPSELARSLRAGGAEKPLVLQIGPHVLYAEAHIPGSEYVGPAGKDAGLEALRERVKSVARSRVVVLYCGCCPWKKCPNVHPAYQQLTSLGFQHVEVLYIADNFGTDWVSKGLAVEKGR